MGDLFNNIKPSFGPFAKIFDHWAGVALAIVWAGGFVFVAYHLIVGIAAIARARAHHRTDGEAQIGKLAWPVGAAIVLTLVPVIWVAVTTAGSQTPSGSNPTPTATSS